MGDSQDRTKVSLHPRRKSLFTRITESISSFLPSGLFESKSESFSACHPVKCRRLDLPVEDSNKEFTKAFYRNRERPVFQTSKNVSTSLTVQDSKEVLNSRVDVDLDANDNSSDSSTGSKTSISTSGVSSLFPRSSRLECSKLYEDRSKFPELADDFLTDSSNFIKDSIMDDTRPKSYQTLWTENDQKKRSSSNVDQPSNKRMRIESSSNSSLPPYSSTFYRGKTSYGGASSLKQCPRFRNIFEHVAPLRFIVESPEKKCLPLNTQSSSSAMLSVTAKRILENLERHGSPITANDKIPLPYTSSTPPSLSTPDRVHSVRYPPYLAAFRRFKADQNQTVCFESDKAPSLAKPEAKSQENLKSRLSKMPTLRLYEERASLSTHIPPVSSLSVSRNSPPISDSSVAEHHDVVYPLKSSNSIQVTMNSMRRISSSPTFTFSNPIVLNQPKLITPVTDTTAARMTYTFSLPKPPPRLPSLIKNASFLPVLLSPMFSPVKAPSTNVENPLSVRTPVKLDLWRCESCLKENTGSTDSCVSCRLPRSSQRTARIERCQSLSSIPSIDLKPVSPSIHGKSDEWECATCMVKNGGSITRCICCQSPRTMLTSEGSKSQPSLNLLPKTSTWECPSCRLSNRDTFTICVGCQTKRTMSTITESSKVSFNFGMKKSTIPTSEQNKVNSESPRMSDSINSTGNISTTAPTTLFGNPPPPLSSSFLLNLPDLKTQSNKTSFTFGEPPIYSSLQNKSSSSPLVCNVSTQNPLSFNKPSMPSFSKVETLSSEAASTSSNFTFGFKEANFAVVKPSTSLSFSLSSKPSSGVPTSTPLLNHVPTGLDAASNLFNFGSVTTASPVFSSAPVAISPVLPPTFVFGSTQMKENVTPFSGFPPSGNAMSKLDSLNPGAAPVSFSTVFKFGESNQTVTNPSPFSFTASTPANSPFSSTGKVSAYTNIHGRPVRRAFRRQHKG